MKTKIFRTGFLALVTASLSLHFLLSLNAMADGFVTNPSMTIPRSGHTAVLLGDGRVLVAGGNTTNATSGPFGYLTNKAEIFDPNTGAWTAINPMNIDRGGATATLLQNGNVLLAGGISDHAGYFTNTEIYNPSTGLWTTMGPLHTNRVFPNEVLLTNGKVLLVGGRNNVQQPLATAEIYNPASGTWTQINGPASPRYSTSATLLQDGRVLVAGGTTVNTNSVSTNLATAELFDPVTQTWSPTGSMGTSHSGHRATLLQDGRVLVSGGGSTNNAICELYNPQTGTWSNTGSLNVGRSVHLAQLLTNGLVLVAAGANSNFLSSVELYNPATGTWTPTNGLSQPRIDFTGTLLADGRVMVAGGAYGLTLYAGTEIYDSSPTITLQPTNQTVDFGTSTSFSVQAVGRSLQYQWFKDGLPLTNGTHLSGVLTSNLTLTSISTNDSGTYTVVVSNLAGNVTSDGALLTVLLTPPYLTSQPTNVTVSIGDTAVFQVVAGGSPVLAYQWLKNGNPLADGLNISGATTTTLTINNGTVPDSGVYSVVITNQFGSLTSTDAVLSVLFQVPDPNLREACYESLVLSGILPPPANPTGEYYLDHYAATTQPGVSAGNLNAADLACLTSLGIGFNGGPTSLDLEGLQYATNLQDFLLYGNSAQTLENTRRLSGLTQMTQLTLNNFISPGLGFLTNLPQLQNLQLEDDAISDASSLSALVNLTTLDINYNFAITNLAFAAGMSQLQTLQASYNAIEDVSPLLALTNLTRIELTANQLTNASLLAAKTNLQRLHLEFDGLTNAGFTSNLFNLESLNIGNNLLSGTSLSFLSALTNLSELQIHSDGVTNINFLTGLYHLNILSIQGNHLPNLAALSGLTNLVQLDASSDSVTNIAALAQLKNLSSLYLHANQLTNVTPLAGLTNSMRYLFLQDNLLQNINSLTNLTGLVYLDLRNNYLNTTPNSAPAQAVQFLQSHGVTVDFLPQHSLAATLSNPAINGVQFSFLLTSQSGLAFEVQFSTNLTSWSVVRNVTNTTGSLNITNLPVTGSKGFYRLRGL